MVETLKGIITLCGSTKFYETFDEVMLELTKADYAVFTIGSHRGADSSLNPSVHGYRPLFEALHKSKIDISQAIVVINKDWYIGEHTKGEIEYANNKDKKIYYYNAWPIHTYIINGFDYKTEMDWKELI